MARKANSDEFRNALEKRVGTEEYDRISSDGQQDPTKGGRYSAKEVISEFRERPKGVSVDEGSNSMVSKYQGLVDGGAKFNNKAKSYLESRGVNFGAKETPKPAAASNNGTASGKNSINSPISQANPQTVNGNNNKVSQDNSITQTVDNSVDNSKNFNDNSYRSYGADSGRSSLDGADDSPAAAQRFMDMYIDSNKLNQRSMRNEYEFYGNSDYGANDRFGAETREKGLNDSIQASEDKYKNMNKSIFGGANPFGMNYENPETPDPIESNAEDIYKQARKDIK